jgi:uncharacterized protein (TIGR00369 family)
MLDVQAVTGLLEPLFPGMFGVKVTEVGIEKVLGELELREDFYSVGDVIHASVYLVLADTLCVVGTLMNNPKSTQIVTKDSSTKFLAPALMDSLIKAEARAFHRGKSTMVWQVSIQNSEGKLCCIVTQTMQVLDPVELDEPLPPITPPVPLDPPPPPPPPTPVASAPAAASAPVEEAKTASK